MTSRPANAIAPRKESSRGYNARSLNVVFIGIDEIGGIQITGALNPSLESIRLVLLIWDTKEDAARVPPELGIAYPEPRGIMPGYGVFARHVKRLELANLNFACDEPDLRPAMACVDVDGLEVDNFKAQVAPGVSAASLTNNVRGIVIRNSPVLQGIGSEQK